MIRIQVCIVICGDQKGPPAKRPSESITLLFFRINESIKIYLVFGQLFLGKKVTRIRTCVAPSPDVHGLPKSAGRGPALSCCTTL